MRIFFIFLCSCLFLTANATHYRAGDIVYEHVDGLTYKVTVTSCTNTLSTADSDSIFIDWGDGTSERIPRVNIVTIAGNNQLNDYVGFHTYAGPDAYEVCAWDQNRVAGITNINSSSQIAFSVQALIVISPFIGNNSSPILLNPAKDRACVNRLFIHNPAAYETEGDSLVYEMLPSTGNECDVIPLYEFPHLAGGGIMSVNAQTGDLVWDVPQLQGLYNVAIRIYEYREGVLVGYITRDVHIDVGLCNNNPPVIAPIADTCVNAGDVLNSNVSATDVDDHNMNLDAFGGPFQVNQPAQFNVTTDQNGFIQGQFSWATDCEHVIAGLYHVSFEANDLNDPGADIPLSDVEGFSIRIVAPAPTGLTVTPAANNMDISWDPSVCANASGYKIYRREGSYGFTPSHCETGVPAYTGYTLVGTTSGHASTIFTDQIGLAYGEEYCYMIVACFPDGAESYASDEVCNGLSLELPVITNVSVGETDVAAGVDTVRWVHPLELDVQQWGPPYQYELYAGSGFTGNGALIFTSPTENDFNQLPTEYLNTSINTLNEPHHYRIRFFSNGVVVGDATLASSVFVAAAPSDNAVTLTWSENVPWTNTVYEVYREDAGSLTLLGTTPEQTWVDTGLLNGVSYCYVVKSTGAYSDPLLPSPLENWSQEVCAVPVDLTPPCPPELTVNSDCEYGENELLWTNPNNFCADDVVAYQVYFTPVEGEPFQLISTIPNSTDTTLFHGVNGSVAGCYYVTATDTFDNQSLALDTVCVDNCPIYVLPNVFSPNGDGVNDYFKPFPYRHVEDIQLYVYNRWGKEVFSTTDPDILWDGTSVETGEPVSDGVYYYTCTVFTVRLSGIEPINLTGYVQVFNERNPNSN